MLIEYIDNLLQTSMTIRFKGRSLTINHLVIDTGAAHTLLSSDIVTQVGIHFENGDKLVRSFGIGGDEYSFRKQIDQVQLGNFVIDNFYMDFGVFHEDIDQINGLIGLDILKGANMVIDLYRMEMHPASL
ncbi:retroviral-like aspartic protease family protein [Paenibacillus sp. p3-SID867]|uniref:retropepsin-like aspartic protease n=1 Tax=Paenibacillus sp. p3-SID867 TaxID=2916363 RepID=UPI0021A7C143|nr:retropepsin-like aspartic protease [Paenibacillus sp. p3-SID867]MCT1398503.1 retroviral-like aspartic protease family protein [Paenibacillus sp. p3-SID867]